VFFIVEKERKKIIQQCFLSHCKWLLILSVLRKNPLSLSHSYRCWSHRHGFGLFAGRRVNCWRFCGDFKWKLFVFCHPKILG